MYTLKNISSAIAFLLLGGGLFLIPQVNQWVGLQAILFAGGIYLIINRLFVSSFWDKAFAFFREEIEKNPLRFWYTSYFLMGANIGLLLSVFEQVNMREESIMYYVVAVFISIMAGILCHIVLKKYTPAT